jgi:glycerophosphoryl diester phosphodiesterase
LEALKESLKFSNRKTLETIAMLLLVFVIYTVILTTVLFIIFMPLFIIDEFLPRYGHVLAAFTLTAAQGAIFMMFGLLQSMFSQVLIFVAFRLTKLKPIAHRDKGFHRGVMQWTYLLAIYAFFLWSGINYLNIAQTIYEPETKIIGHRGFLDKGVENTISSLQEAAKAGSDLVEIDIQQTKDGEFVVFHDKTLRRLAGRGENVYNMTLEELMDVTVYSDGNSDKIPSLDQMLEESEKLKIKLLIEIKTHGYETDDFVERLVTKLEDYNSIDIHYIQSLEYPLAVAINEYEPRLRVGSVHAVAIGSLPNYGLDFVAIEQSFVTSNLIAQAKKQDIEIFVWTVNTIASIQHFLIENVDGIITNYPDISYVLRDELEENKHFLRRVWNKINIIF